MSTITLISAVLAAISQAVGLNSPPVIAETSAFPSAVDETQLYLVVAEGELDYNCSSDFCEYYFHVPITYGNQVPVILTVEAPDLIDYRFIRMENNNVLCVARMGNGSGIISWQSCVMVEENTWDDIPSFVAIPDPASLPDTVASWLESTDCCQLSSPYVAAAIQETGTGIVNVIELADSVESFVADIPWELPHIPMAFDAHYAIKYGNSCTGHAHAAAALFRGNGIPSRALLNIPTFLGPSSWFDQHWIIDYFVPDYGWVMAEAGCPTVPPEVFIVTFVVQPYQEFTKWYNQSIDGLWHSSSPVIYEPDCEGGHRAYDLRNDAYEGSLVDQVMALEAELWDMHTTYTGLILTPAEAQQRAEAEAFMNEAYAAINNGDINGCISYAETAISHYQSISLEEMEVSYFEDFESGAAGWTHGGVQDQWELGAPQSGPDSAFSGASCWGTNLSGNYADNANCWLLSPVIDLGDKSCAELSFWIWNDIEDMGWTEPDTFFVAVSYAGQNAFIPLSDGIEGVNNDPEIVAGGGWTRIVLDLRRHITNRVQFRFTLLSDGQNNFPGAYIDNVQVCGRYKDLTGISSSESFGNASVACSPNPCSFSTSIDVNMPREGIATVAIYDLTGRRVAAPAHDIMTGGMNRVAWNCRDENGGRLPAGIYIIRVDTETECITGKLVITSH